MPQSIVCATRSDVKPSQAKRVQQAVTSLEESSQFDEGMIGQEMDAQASNQADEFHKTEKEAV